MHFSQNCQNVHEFEGHSRRGVFSLANSEIRNILKIACYLTVMVIELVQNIHTPSNGLLLQPVTLRTSASHTEEKYFSVKAIYPTVEAL